LSVDKQAGRKVPAWGFRGRTRDIYGSKPPVNAK